MQVFGRKTLSIFYMCICVYLKRIVVSCMVWCFAFLKSPTNTHPCFAVCIFTVECMTLRDAAVVLFSQVVPLSQRSGVLEWCSRTTPIGEFLVNVKEGAHKRYRPKDYSSCHCQKMMMVSHNNYESNRIASSFFTGG